MKARHVVAKRIVAVWCVSILWQAGFARAQSKPDLSGVWTLDAARSDSAGTYGQVRLITQTPTEFNLTVLQRERNVSEISVVPWKLRLGRYGPRRGEEGSREPVVQSRWDGDQLVTLKSPGESYSLLWIWSLLNAGQDLVVESISTPLPWAFDFKRSSLPKGRAFSRHVYVRSPVTSSCSNCSFQVDYEGLRSDVGIDGGVRFRFENASNLEVACLITSCNVTKIIDGRRHVPMVLGQGQVARLSLSDQWAVGLPK